jgi:hypothetical protein
MTYATHGGKNIAPVLAALQQPSPRYPAYSQQSRPVGPDDAEGGGEGEQSQPFRGGDQTGSIFVLPTTWNGTHVTDGLGWGTKTAEDIMLKAGTALGAPMAGTVEYYHPSGAQGGGSELFNPDQPGMHDFWIGHLDAGRVGHVKRGGYIARVSSRHSRPHVHIDRGPQ